MCCEPQLVEFSLPVYQEQEDQVEAQELEQEKAQQARVELLVHSPPQVEVVEESVQSQASMTEERSQRKEWEGGD